MFEIFEKIQPNQCGICQIFHTKIKRIFERDSGNCRPWLDSRRFWNGYRYMAGELNEWGGRRAERRRLKWILFLLVEFTRKKRELRKGRIWGLSWVKKGKREGSWGAWGWEWRVWLRYFLIKNAPKLFEKRYTFRLKFVSFMFLLFNF